jgi:hypothetical protein
MSERDRIQEGDKVNVFFATSEMIAGATVLYTPADTGDCWHLREQCGALTYVQQFDKMELIEVIPLSATPPGDGGLREVLISRALQEIAELLTNPPSVEMIMRRDDIQKFVADMRALGSSRKE